MEAPNVFTYGSKTAMLMGGNAILTRSILNRLGPYADDLGRNGARTLADEDTDMSSVCSRLALEGCIFLT